MIRRMMLSGVLACSLVAVTALGPADAAQRKTLRGKTSQGYKIRAAVKNRSVDILGFKAQLSCRDGSKLVLDESGFLNTPVSKGGGFRDTQYGSSDTVYIRGAVKGHRVRGKLKVKDKIGRVKCRSKWLKFNLRR